MILPKAIAGKLMKRTLFKKVCTLCATFLISRYIIHKFTFILTFYLTRNDLLFTDKCSMEKSSIVQLLYNQIKLDTQCSIRMYTYYRIPHGCDDQGNEFQIHIHSGFVYVQSTLINEGQDKLPTLLHRHMHTVVPSPGVSYMLQVH